MARKVLLITVGGSCQPVIKSIQQNKPEMVFFICSADSGKNKGSYTTVNGDGLVCKGNPGKKEPDKENILKQVNSDFEYKIIQVSNPDNINSCFEVCSAALKSCKKEYPDSSIIIDYTGGTKSMSAGLVLAASSIPDITVSLVSGIRNDLTKTVDGTEQISLIKVSNAYLDSYFSKAKLLLTNYDYFGTLNLMEKLLSDYPDLPKNYKTDAEMFILASKAFDYWDKFEHIKSYKLFSNSPLKDIFPKYYNSLRILIISKSFLENSINLEEIGIRNSFQISNFEIVFDLIQNANRKAKVGSFDDAVARIYRSLELFIQILLKKKYSLYTSDLDLNKIPESDLKEKLSKSQSLKKQTALLDSYKLLGTLDPQDEAFERFQTVNNYLLRVLEVRNHSILAHGFNPVGKVKFNEIYGIAVQDFLFSLILDKLEKRFFYKEQLPNSF